MPQWKKLVALLETQQFQQMNPGGWIGTWADVGFMWATLRCSITLGWSIKNRDTSCCTHTHTLCIWKYLQCVSCSWGVTPMLHHWLEDKLPVLDEYFRRSYKDSDSGEVANLSLGTGNILMLHHGESWSRQLWENISMHLGWMTAYSTIPAYMKLLRYFCDDP